MKNNSFHAGTHTPGEKTPFEDILAENPIVHWISENGRTIIILFLAVLAFFFIAYRLSSGYIVKSELNFINAENDFQRFMAEKNSTQLEGSLNKLQSVLKAHPELAAKYDGPITEKLIAFGYTAEALPFGTRAIERTTSENNPSYTDYSKTSLLIAEKKYDAALQQSLKLKETLEPNGLLSALNLLRLGILQQQLGLAAQELETWTEWKNSKDESFDKLTNHFNIEKLSLTNYIEEREKVLRKS